jgi:Ca-activated chloride channel homolog
MMLTIGPITWADAQYSVMLAPVMGILLWVLIRHLRWQKQSVDKLAATPYRHRLLRHFSLTKSRIKTALLATALLLLTLSLARPQWGVQEQMVTQEGRDLLIALDISRSMLAADAHPTRLEHAKNKIKALVHHLGSDRIGLLLFSGKAFMYCPLTRDTEAFISFLDATSAETISSGTTSLDQAISKALEVFTKMPTKKHKILILFTDGEDFSGNIEKSIKQAQQAGLLLFTVGIGTTQGAPIPLLDEKGQLQGHQQDKEGHIVISRLNEELLSSLAHTTGAVYVRSTENSRDIDLLVQRIRAFEKEQFGDTLSTVKQEKYFYWALGALVCLMLEWLL